MWSGWFQFFLSSPVLWVSFYCSSYSFSLCWLAFEVIARDLFLSAAATTMKTLSRVIPLHFGCLCCSLSCQSRTRQSCLNWPGPSCVEVHRTESYGRGFSCPCFLILWVEVSSKNLYWLVNWVANIFPHLHLLGFHSSILLVKFGI